MFPLRLYDSMRHEKVPFTPIEPGRVGMYVCGPTTYAPAHIGHAYSAILFDTIRRSLEFLGWQVTYVRNVTDVDDKIIRRANEVGEDPMALSARFTAEYNRDMGRFGVRAPTVEPKVTEHIPQIIAIIERLIANGKAYAVDGDVYFEVATFAPYGKLSGQSLDELRAGARIDVDERKRSPEDFAVWKSAKPNEPWWESPWGKGRPGWHIECSAMTVTHLGVTFDLHGGGKDLIFPHHENEIAQSQGADGIGTFAHYWLHNGFLNFAGEKMSKSLGNVFGCNEIADAVGGEALRYFCVEHHYRSPVDFEVEAVRDEGGAQIGVRFRSLETSDRTLEYFYMTLQKIDAVTGDSGGPASAESDAFLGKVREALADDFNTPVVVAALHEVAKLANKLLDDKKLDKALRAHRLACIGRDLRAVGVALGILQSTPADYLAARRARLVDRKKLDVSQVENLIAGRIAARASKQFTEADALRKQLVELGVEVFDTPGGGTDWRIQDDAGPG